MRMRRPRFRLAYRVKLECGHAVRTRDFPLGDSVRYGCTSGLGCGYQLRWVEWWNIDRPEIRYDNDVFRKEKENSGEGEHS